MKRATTARAAALPGALWLSAMLAACAGEGDAGPGARGDGAGTDPGFEARGAEIVETGPDGEPRYRVQAAVVSQDPRSRQVQLQQVRLRLADAGGASWQVDARAGQMPADAGSIDLSGDVQVRGRAAPGDELLAIRSEQLSYDFDRQLARSNTDVTLTMGARALAARGLVADLKAGRVQLESGVHGRFPPQ
ncbi:MAG: LPS export ABC transporter periplasmic protein LptC [Steroidobacteraceae bacterium]